MIKKGVFEADCESNRDMIVTNAVAYGRENR